MSAGKPVLPVTGGITPRLALKRPGAALEVADAILYLLPPSASSVTGAILNVSGGR